MNVKSWVLRTAAFYALRRVFGNVSSDELQKWSDEIGEAALRIVGWHARRRSSALLKHVGLEYRRTSTETTALVLGGLGTGIALGVGGALLSTEEGREIVQRGVERVKSEVEQIVREIERGVASVDWLPEQK